jgi:uncharacterized membrane protein YqhA
MSPILPSTAIQVVPLLVEVVIVIQVVKIFQDLVEANALTTVTAMIMTMTMIMIASKATTTSGSNNSHAHSRKASGKQSK